MSGTLKKLVWDIFAVNPPKIEFLGSTFGGQFTAYTVWDVYV